MRTRALALLAAATAYAQTIAIPHVTVIDVAAGAAIADQTVVVDGGRIVASGPAARVRIPAGARVLPDHAVDIGEGGSPVDPRLPGAEQVQVRSVQDERSLQEWRSPAKAANNRGPRHRLSQQCVTSPFA